VAGGSRIFFAGDTAYASFFRDVREPIGSIDLALLPIGAYEPRWFMQSVHMNPAEAVQAHADLEASESVGMHFGTFQMTTEGIDEPLTAIGVIADSGDRGLDDDGVGRIGDTSRQRSLCGLGEKNGCA
jgi:L-ascorbate metabolism protein UlaG (beta-lactamase superfamily)